MWARESIVIKVEISCHAIHGLMRHEKLVPREIANLARFREAGIDWRAGRGKIGNQATCILLLTD